jgi:ATP phosphoribosyltransferase regulatory subunit
MQNQKYILPIGFYDLLGDEARVNQETIDLLLNSFYAAQYQLIKTPLVEFEESLDNGKSDQKAFKMVDNFSGKTLVVRSDITPQIARLMATKLKDATMPIRLCYVGDVLKIKNDNLYADRQLTQVGVELIGQEVDLNSCAFNLEVIELSLSSLKKIKLSNLMINFCCPQFLDNLLAGLNLKNADDLRVAITSKNIAAIKKLAGNFADNLIALILENNDFDKISRVVTALPVNQKVFEQLEKWQKTIFEVKQNHPEINFSVDIFGDEEFSYHNQIGFTIFASGLSYPIARGGRYLINDKIPAVGSTIYINNLRKILVKL